MHNQIDAWADFYPQVASARTERNKLTNWYVRSKMNLLSGSATQITVALVFVHYLQPYYRMNSCKSNLSV